MRLNEGRADLGAAVVATSEQPHEFRRKVQNRGNYSIAGVCDQSLKATTTLFA